MKLECINNQYEIRGPMNDGQKYSLDLIVGKIYEGTIAYGAHASPGDYIANGYQEQWVFACFDDNGKWDTYALTKFFGVK